MILLSCIFRISIAAKGLNTAFFLSVFYQIYPYSCRKRNSDICKYFTVGPLNSEFSCTICICGLRSLSSGESYSIIVVFFFFIAASILNRKPKITMHMKPDIFRNTDLKLLVSHSTSQ